jgi:hypothetical protein
VRLSAHRVDSAVVGGRINGKGGWLVLSTSDDLPEDETMKKLLILGLLMLVVGGGVLLFGPDGIVTDCPLAGGTGILASPCSDAIDAQVSNEAETRGWAELMTAGGALLAGLASVIAVIRR